VRFRWLPARGSVTHGSPQRVRRCLVRGAVSSFRVARHPTSPDRGFRGEAEPALLADALALRGAWELSLSIAVAELDNNVQVRNNDEAKLWLRLIARYRWWYHSDVVLSSWHAPCRWRGMRLYQGLYRRAVWLDSFEQHQRLLEVLARRDVRPVGGWNIRRDAAADLADREDPWRARRSAVPLRLSAGGPRVSLHPLELRRDAGLGTAGGDAAASALASGEQCLRTFSGLAGAEPQCVRAPRPWRFD
jgi:hypothetical protein